MTLTSLCAICSSPGQRIEALSALSFIDYYRCQPCGHVWSDAKAGGHVERRDAEPQHELPAP